MPKIYFFYRKYTNNHHKITHQIRPFLKQFLIRMYTVHSFATQTQKILRVTHTTLK